MKERPILFSAPMIRALLSGSKTQTRRVVKHGIASGHSEAFQKTQAFQDDLLPYCPYGQPGDRLYVRETWRTTGDGGRADYLAPRDMQPHPVWYDADGTAPAEQYTGKTRVSIHMPRWASRILLEIVSVRVERLQAISDDDCWAEGSQSWAAEVVGGKNFPDKFNNIRRAWQVLWTVVNGADGWDANPWVWVVEFKRVGP